MGMGPTRKGVTITFQMEDTDVGGSKLGRRPGGGGGASGSGHRAMASGDIHSSILEPPKELDIRPCGTPVSL